MIGYGYSIEINIVKIYLLFKLQGVELFVRNIKLNLSNPDKSVLTRWELNQRDFFVLTHNFKTGEDWSSRKLEQT